MRAARGRQAHATSAHVLVLAEGLPYPFDPRIRGQVAALTGAGYAVTVAGPTGPGAEALDETIDDVRVLRFRAPSGGRGAVGYLREYAVATLRLARLVRRISRASAVDLVLVCGPPDSLVALALPLARRGAGIVFDLREISPELFEAKFGRRGPLHRLLLASERFALRRADAVITVSEPCAQIARTRGGVAPDRIFHVGNGPDPQRIFDVPARAELRRGHEHLVLWLGCMSSQEGLSRLIEAADHVVNDLGRKDVQFALVGPGDVHDELRELVRLRHLEDAVLVEGQVDDDCVRAYMATADVCVNVDERNAMNDRAAMRKVMEYMAMGRPVVQFPLAEMRRLCGDATAYARNADARDLAAQIVKLLDDPERRERLGNLARARAHEGLMWPRQVPALLAAVAVAATGAGCGTDAPGGAPTHGSGGAGEPLLFDAFAKANGPNGLITNEYALSNADGVRSPRWEMTSGSLFVRDGSGWSGVPDTTAPDRLSRRATDSAVFRLRTKAASFGDVVVRAEVRVNRWLRARPGVLPAIVLWVRYASERRLYWPSVLRADGKVDVEKKVPGGRYPENGGTYYILPPFTVRGWPVRLGRWYRVAVSARTASDGSVTIATYRDGRRMLTAVDRGRSQVVQYARDGKRARNPTLALAGLGHLGIRADNADFSIRNYEVRGVGPLPSVSSEGRLEGG